MFKKPPLLHDHYHLTKTCGLDHKTIDTFEVGYCPEECDDVLAGRIVIPLHDIRSKGKQMENKLVGYAGWHLGKPSLKTPEYIFKMHSGYKESDVVFNLNRAWNETYPIQMVVVKDPISVLKLHTSHGYRQLVALMGDSMSQGQERRFSKWSRKNPLTRVSIVLNGNGRQFKQAMFRLAKITYVKHHSLPLTVKPERISREHFDCYYV